MKLQHKPNDSPSSYGGYGVRTTPGEVIDTEDLDTDDVDLGDNEDVGEALLETGYFQRADEDTDANTVDDGASDEVEPPFDPTELTVAEIRERLNGEDYTDAEMVAMADVEREGGEDRDGAIDLLSASPPTK